MVGASLALILLGIHLAWEQHRYRLETPKGTIWVGMTKQEVEGEILVEIGYHVRRDLWGQGLAPEAAGACRDYGFTRLQVDRLISLIRPENFPSRRVAEKNGMTLWKTVLWRGLPHCVYAISRPPASESSN